ncbi:hypothetical protein M8623_003350 [Salmonella enterica subsp. enterica]|nr:hypothetical protein [Salmonella enterica subsp. enterica]
MREQVIEGIERAIRFMKKKSYAFQEEQDEMEAFHRDVVLLHPTVEELDFGCHGVEGELLRLMIEKNEGHKLAPSP